MRDTIRAARREAARDIARSRGVHCGLKSGHLRVGECVIRGSGTSDVAVAVTAAASSSATIAHRERISCKNEKNESESKRESFR